MPARARERRTAGPQPGDRTSRGPRDGSLRRHATARDPWRPQGQRAERPEPTPRRAALWTAPGRATTRARARDGRAAVRAPPLPKLVRRVATEAAVCDTARAAGPVTTAACADAAAPLAAVGLGRATAGAGEAAWAVAPGAAIAGREGSVATTGCWAGAGTDSQALQQNAVQQQALRQQAVQQQAVQRPPVRQRAVWRQAVRRPAAARPAVPKRAARGSAGRGPEPRWVAELPSPRRAPELAHGRAGARAGRGSPDPVLRSELRDGGRAAGARDRRSARSSRQGRPRRRSRLAGRRASRGASA